MSDLKSLESEIILFLSDKFSDFGYNFHTNVANQDFPHYTWEFFFFDLIKFKFYQFPWEDIKISIDSLALILYNLFLIDQKND